MHEYPMSTATFSSVLRPAPMWQLPRSASGWLLAACLFFVPLTSYRVVSFISYCDVLFVAAVLAGIAERVVRGDVLLTRFEGRIVQIYMAAAGVFVLCFLVNAIEHNLEGYQFQQQRPLGVPGKLPETATLLFGGSAPQNPRFIIFLINTVAVPLSMLLLPRRELAEMRFLVLAWSAGCLYGAGYAVAYVKGYLPGVIDWSWVYLRRVSGLTMHANVLGLSSVMAMPGLFMILFSRAPALLRLAVLPLFWLVWLAVDYSGSRAAAGAFFLFPLVYLSMLGGSWSKRLQTVALLVPAGFVMWASLVFLYQGGEGVLHRVRFGGLSSNAARDLINRLSWEQAMESPLFGTGFQVLRIAHNIFLQIFHAAGLVGLLAYLVVMLLPLCLLLRASLQLPKTLRGLVAAIATAMSVVITLSIFKPSLTDLSTSIVFALTLYLVVLLHARSAMPRRIPRA